MSFSDDIEKFADKFEAKTNKIFRIAAFEVAKRVIKRTPVGNPTLWKGRPPPGYAGGRLRANWQAGIDRKPKGLIKGKDSTGSNTTNNALGAAGKLMIGRKFYLLNNLPYAKSIEDGSSTQAPKGMVKITVAEWKNIVKFAAGTL